MVSYILAIDEKDIDLCVVFFTKRFVLLVC